MTLSSAPHPQLTHLNTVRQTSLPQQVQFPSKLGLSLQSPRQKGLFARETGVNSTIRTLYNRGFAEVTAWSPLQPTSNPGEVMSVLGRHIPIQ